MANPRRLEQVYCSLNLGYIYNVSFDFDPQEGATIVVTFVNETGEYDTSFLSAIVPASIKIGKASFQMYPIRYNYQKDGSRKVIAVTFIDDFHKLNNYYIVLGKRGCGTNTFSLGVPILDLTAEFKLTLQERKIRDLTTIFDLEYAFGDFIKILQGIFPVEVSAGATEIANQTVATGQPGDNPNHNIITRNFTGSFKEVLNAWCSYLDLFYFIENGKIKIFSPVDLNIKFPDAPDDALSFDQTESLENTYSKTASFYFENEGGQTNIPTLADIGGAASVNKTDQNNGKATDNNFTTFLTMYPYNSNLAFNTFNRSSGEPDIQQCIAASYGEEFWFLYNFYNQIGAITIRVGASKNPDGSEDENTGILATYLPEIGLTFINNSSLIASVAITNGVLGGSGVSLLDRQVFSSNFNKYFQYGREKAGRFYMTFPQNNLDYYDQFTFLITSKAVDFLTGVSLISEPSLRLEKFTSPIGTEPDSLDPIPGILPNSSVAGFEGLPAVGNRLIYFDNTQVDYDSIFALTADEKSTLISNFDLITQGVPASNNFNSDFLGGGNWVVFASSDIPSFITNKINEFLVNQPALFARNGQNIGFTGYAKINNLNIAATNPVGQGNNQTTKNQQTTGANNGVNSTSNTEINNGRQSSSQNVQVITANQITTITSFGDVRQSTLNPFAYFSKLEKCSSLSQEVGSNVLNHRFEARQISVDTPLKVVLAIQGRFYIVSRDTSFINDPRWQSILQLVSHARTFTDKSISFSTNYFYEVPEDFLTSGLTSMSVQVGAAGLSATYTFSNKMMAIPNFESQEAKIERAIKQSAIRQFNTFARFNDLQTI